MTASRRSCLSRLIVTGLLVLLLPSLLLLVAQGQVRTYLNGLTGEDDLREQIKGLGRLLVLQVTQRPLELAPYTPMPHTGINPFGVNTFLEQEVEPQKVEQALRMIREAGFGWIRQEFPWEDIEQSARGDFWDHKWNKSAWDKYDLIVDLANEQGLEIIARLDNPPAWSRALGNVSGTLGPPDDYNDYGNFVHAVVSRYRGRVKYYQIWNEPNLSAEWGGQPVDPAAYVRLLQIAYRRAKEADPDCVIISAGLAQTLEQGPENLDDLAYLERMYEAGVQGYFDIMGVMAYGLWTGPGDHRTAPDLTNFSRPQLVRDIMVRHGDADKPLWATELGWNAAPPELPPIYGRVSEEQQARLAVAAYERAQREWPWMGMMNYWFFKRATDSERNQTFYYFRMVEPDMTPLPVYEALKEYATRPPRMFVGYHQEDHWALQYEGEWQHVEDEQAVLGRLMRTERPGDRVTLTFEGTTLELVTLRAPGSGTLQVTIDERAPVEADLSADVPRYGMLVPVASDLGNGTHHVEMTHVGDEGTFVTIDGIVVRQQSSTARQLVTVTLAGVAFVAVVAWTVRRYL